MTRLNHWKTLTISAGFLIGGAILGCMGTSRSASSAESMASVDLSHVVPFKVTNASSTGPDSITIKQIRGNYDSIRPGGTYQVKGTYHMVSHDQAALMGYVTASDEDSAHSRVGAVIRQEQIVDRGDGEFTVVVPFICKGEPHISFYPTAGGSSFVSVYFASAQ